MENHEKSPRNGGFWLGKSLINGPFSTAMFDYQRVNLITSLEQLCHAVELWASGITDFLLPKKIVISRIQNALGPWVLISLMKFTKLMEIKLTHFGRQKQLHRDRIERI